jgi:protein-glutamine gamma-glutamyltransferase
MKLSARLVAMALPLTMLLFIAFPRISGSILGVPWSRQSRSGFSSVMRMGDVSRLVVTDTPVFSVSFQSPLPEAGQRYWRGIVFQSFDGDTWQPARHQTVRREAIQGKALVRYRVILEPHGYRNLFVLDLPQSATPVARIMDDHTLIAPHPVLQRLTYDATSIVDYRRAGSEYSADRYLQLPPNRNGQTVALGRRLARTHVDPADRVEAGMNIFKNQGFSYTLRPDRLGRDAVDDFLFVSRKGFCEHFASAFTVLMRSAGVPTRMVAGYQGGRWNTWGDFLTVRQADAHVWCEVWLRGQGWVRVDPTFEVAPDRIEAGIDHVLGSLPWLANTGRDHLLSRWIERARLAWEVVNIRWNMWFMGFSAEDQAVLLKNLWHRGQWLLLAVGACVAVVILSRLHRRQRSRQPMTTEQKALIIYNHFLKKLSRVGLVKPSYQGAWHHCQTVARQHPALEREIGAIVGLYLALRYGRKPDDDRLKVLRRLVRRFHPRKLVKREQ